MGIGAEGFSGVGLRPACGFFISQRGFITSFRKCEFLHKSVDFFFVLVIRKDELTHLCRN